MIYIKTLSRRFKDKLRCKSVIDFLWVLNKRAKKEKTSKERIHGKSDVCKVVIEIKMKYNKLYTNG